MKELPLLDERFRIDTEDSYTRELAKQAADFQDMHGRNLCRRNNINIDKFINDSKKLEELGYALDVVTERRGNCTHYKMRLMKIVDTEEYSIKYSVEIK